MCRSRQDNEHNVSAMESLFGLVRERMKRGFTLKQFCRMRIRSILAESANEDILSQVNRLKELSDTSQAYVTYDLKSLLNEPERFYEATQSHIEPVWNSSIPPPPVNWIEWSVEPSFWVLFKEIMSKFFHRYRFLYYLTIDMTLTHHIESEWTVDRQFYCLEIFVDERQKAVIHELV